MTWIVTTIEADFLVFKEDREKRGGGEEGLKANFRLSIMGTW
jgi:hypothetical protein